MALKKRWGKNKIPMHLLVEEFLKDNVAFKGDLLDILWDSRDEFIDWRPPLRVETDGPCAPRLQRSAAAAYAACLASRPAWPLRQRARLTLTPPG